MERQQTMSDQEASRVVSKISDLIDRAQKAEAELARIRNAAEWLIANRGHRGEQQAWKLLADALAKEDA